MKKLAALLLVVILSAGATLPAFARTPKTHNKYRGIDKASRKAQKREQKAMDKYAMRQQKAQNKTLKKGSKKNVYRPLSR